MVERISVSASEGEGESDTHTRIYIYTHLLHDAVRSFDCMARHMPKRHELSVDDPVSIGLRRNVCSCETSQLRCGEGGNIGGKACGSHRVHIFRAGHCFSLPVGAVSTCGARSGGPNLRERECVRVREG